MAGEGDYDLHRSRMELRGEKASRIQVLKIFKEFFKNLLKFLERWGIIALQTERNPFFEEDSDYKMC